MSKDLLKCYNTLVIIEGFQGYCTTHITAYSLPE